MPNISIHSVLGDVVITLYGQVVYQIFMVHCVLFKPAFSHKKNRMALSNYLKYLFVLVSLKLVLCFL